MENRESQGGLRGQRPAASVRAAPADRSAAMNVPQPIVPSRGVAAFAVIRLNLLRASIAGFKGCGKCFTNASSMARALGVSPALSYRSAACSVASAARRAFRPGFAQCGSEFRRRLARDDRFGVRDREISSDLGLQRALRENYAGTTSSTDDGGRSHCFCLTSSAAASKSAFDRSFRGRRQHRHAQEIVHRTRAVAGPALLLALLVNRAAGVRRFTARQLRGAIVRGHQALCVPVSRFGLVDQALVDNFELPMTVQQRAASSHPQAAAAPGAPRRRRLPWGNPSPHKDRCRPRQHLRAFRG